jgi:glycerol-3-phosphate dehydrogenase (NAD+)
LLDGVCCDFTIRAKVAEPDIVKSVEDADYLVFVMPHQFLTRACRPLVGILKPGAIGITLIKGFHLRQDGGLQLISEVINEMLDVPVCCLMGANLAHEVAAGKFCETTVGVHTDDQARFLKALFETETFRVSTVKDVKTVEACGALKVNT